MTEVAGDIQKILTQDVVANNPTSQALFSLIAANINGLIDSFGQFQVFTSSGTFNVPENVSRVFVLGWGGGQGGRGSGSGSRNGGKGAIPTLANVAVTPLASITITIGGGGSGGTPNNMGGNGGNTTFGSLLTFAGAGTSERAGLFYSNGGIQNGANGQSSVYAVGGTSNIGAGGGGAGAGAGANAPSIEQAGINAAANSGGGGSAAYRALTDRNGGNGGSGGLIVFF